MSKYDASTLKCLRESTPKQKLAILRNEMTALIGTGQWVAIVLKQIDPKSVEGLPDKFGFLVDRLAEAGDNLREGDDILDKP